MRAAYVPAAIVVGLLTQVGYAEVSIRILDLWSPTDTIKAGYIGSGIGSFSCSEVAVALAVVCLLARSTGNRGFMIAAGLALVSAVGYDVLTLSSHTIHATAGGQPIDSSIGVRISPAWGAWAILVSAAVVAITAFGQPAASADAEAVPMPVE